MRHTKAISRKPAQAQSAYASKLFFKQELSTTVALNNALLLDGLTVVGTSLFGNALSLGTLFEIIFADDTTT